MIYAVFVEICSEVMLEEFYKWEADNNQSLVSIRTGHLTSIENMLEEIKSMG